MPPVFFEPKVNLEKFKPRKLKVDFLNDLWRGSMVRVSMVVNDRDTGKETVVHMTKGVADEVRGNPSMVRSVIYDAVRELVEHEIMECLEIDGMHYDPHDRKRKPVQGPQP